MIRSQQHPLFCIVVSIAINILLLWRENPVYAEIQLVVKNAHPTVADEYIFGIRGNPGVLCSIQYTPVLNEKAVWQSLVVQVLTNDYCQVIDISHTNSCFYRVIEGSSVPPPNPRSDYLVFIPPGNYLMGCFTNELNRQPNESPQTKVVISRGFWMYRYEVTQKEFGEIMDLYPSDFTGDLLRPAENVAWINATNFCARINNREKQLGHVPLGYEYRLPTEAEWEYACRAGSTNRFSWGDDLDYRQAYYYMWYQGNSHIDGYPKGATGLIITEKYYPTHTVGTRKANAWGLYDMNGNVWEWCVDRYGLYQGGSAIDPTGSSIGDKRIYRGGCMNMEAKYCRSAARAAGDPDDWFNNVGFRPVLAPILDVK